MTARADIGLIGLAVMGQNLILNMNDHGFTVAVFNRTTEKVTRFIEGEARGRDIIGTYSLEELAAALKRPRRVMLMVQAGRAVDVVIGQLLPHLEPGDIIIDGGNSNYEDSRRRAQELEARGLSLRRRWRVRRRRRRALRPLHHAWRFGGSLAAFEADLSGHRSEGGRWHALLRLGRA